ncbi:hypothetical protein Peur_031009 [Populus x canadensis]
MALSPMMMAYDTGPDPVLSNHDLRPVVLHASMKDSETKMFWPTGEAVNHGLGTLKTKLRLEFIISVVKLRQLSCMKCTRHAQVVYNIWIQIQAYNFNQQKTTKFRTAFFNNTDAIEMSLQ